MQDVFHFHLYGRLSLSSGQFALSLSLSDHIHTSLGRGHSSHWEISLWCQKVPFHLKRFPLTPKGSLQSQKVPFHLKKFPSTPKISLSPPKVHFDLKIFLSISKGSLSPLKVHFDLKRFPSTLKSSLPSQKVPSHLQRFLSTSSCQEQLLLLEAGGCCEEHHCFKVCCPGCQDIIHLSRHQLVQHIKH
uniref:Uncharacterized protein n=1 Tax=Zonotrichia albicollis TaxID=44394 RepID=A0A8D2MVC9_ZONAL